MPNATEPGATPLPPGGVIVEPAHEFFFDLNGYLVLRRAIDSAHLQALNGTLDRILALQPPLRHGEWFGGVHAHTFGGKDGINLQQIYEAGEPFESLIDHPAWFNLVKHFVGAEGTFDAVHGPVFIDENFANVRGPGEAIGIHSGGHEGVIRCQFRHHNGRFHCGQVNILMALNDIGPGDGATMVIPGSHKSHMPHPDMDAHRIKSGQATSADGMEGAVEVHLNAGDALLFVDAVCHGSAKRVNPGERRIIVYRYGPSWGFFRHPYRPSGPLLSRLTERRRQVVMPHRVLPRTPNRVPDFPEIDVPEGPMLVNPK